MAPESIPLPADAGPALPRPRPKYRLRFRKDGELRLVSHHDLMHCFERMLRRAALPFAVTEGFHPMPRVVFAQSLALGVVGLAEVVELELTEPLAAHDILERLVRQAPPGLTFLSIKALEARAAARVRRACYQVQLPAGAEAGVRERCQELLTQDRLWVHRARPKPRRFNVRPLLSELSAANDMLTLWLWVTPNGGARPEELMHLLGLKSLLDDGCLIERTTLELEDEVGPEAPPPPQLRQGELTEEALDNQELPGPAEEPVGARPTALISGPLSFDS